MESSAAYSALSLSGLPESEDEGGGGPMDTIGEEDQHYEQSEQRMTLAAGLQHLPSRERAILHLRFFEGLTQSEIADRVGISQMHVSRLIRNSLDTIRDELESDASSAGPAG
jgi:RNA polymerase sigma-B factor